MKNFWTKTLRRLAAGTLVAGATAFHSAICYANAFDSASDPVYADGWQAGDNGGSGFTAWNFDSAYYWSFANNGDGNFYPYNSGIHGIDNGLQLGTQFSNPHNAIGPPPQGLPPNTNTWAMAAVEYDNPNTAGADFSFPRAGRGFAPLEIGQTLNVVIDNPTKRVFFKGYFIRLNGGTGGVNGNICNGGENCSPGGTPVNMSSFRTFEYFTNGQWTINDTADTNTGLFDTDTSASGARFSVTRTGANTYDMQIDPFGPAPAFASTGRTFSNGGSPLDWIEFTFFPGAASDTSPTLAEVGTDFYIREMSIVPEPGSGVLLAIGAGSLLGLGAARRRKSA